MTTSKNSIFLHECILRKYDGEPIAHTIEHFYEI